MIHREGYATIALSLLVSLVLILIFKWLFPFLLPLAYAISLFLIVTVLQFFRNPSRPIAVENDNWVYAPADGKVVVIEEVFEPEYFNEKRLLVSVFMSPINVHVNRASFGGSIEYAKYHPGKYLVAWHPKSSTENERTTVVIKNDAGKSVLLRQIAGALAKRIVYYVKAGDRVKQGQEFGFIKFGSRVDVYLPLDAKLKVELQQVVKGNIDVLAEI